MVFVLVMSRLVDMVLLLILNNLEKGEAAGLWVCRIIQSWLTFCLMKLEINFYSLMRQWIIYYGTTKGSLLD
jgi:hypothetical protein